MSRKYFIVGILIIVIAWICWRSIAPQRSLTTCKFNLKCIGLALHAYHASQGSFPAAYSQSLPPHSWRVALLPWLNQQQSHVELSELGEQLKNSRLTSGSEVPAR